MTQRCHAGRALVAGALGGIVVSAGVLSGCGLVPSNRAGNSTPPTGGGPTAPAQTTQPAASQTPTAPARSVTAANLLTVDDVYVDDPMTMEVVEAPDGQGRPVSQSYICLPENGLASLGATSMVTRNFTYKIIDPDNDPNPNSPLKNTPSVYTQALQFSDAAAATAARSTYAGWIKNCAKTLSDQGYGIDSGQSVSLVSLPEDGAKAQAGMVAYVQPGVSDTDHLYWESAGVTQVGDRLMLTISISWGEDSPGSFDQSEGDFINPQVGLVEASIDRLAA